MCYSEFHRKYDGKTSSTISNFTITVDKIFNLKEWLFFMEFRDVDGVLQRMANVRSNESNKTK